MTLPGLADEVMGLQDASNLQGLAQRFPLAINELADALRAAGQHHGTDSVARHPVTRWWVSKLAALAGEPTPEDYRTVVGLSLMHLQATELSGGPFASCPE